MSSVETGQKSAVETGQMSAAETGQMSAVETRQMYNIKTGQRPVARVDIYLVSTHLQHLRLPGDHGAAPGRGRILSLPETIANTFVMSWPQQQHLLLILGNNISHR